MNPGLIVVEKGTTLVDLAAQANAEHRACMAAAGSALAHAIRAGEALSAAKEIVDRGNWEGWVGDHVEISPNQVRAYMRLARYQHHLPAHETRITHAVKYLRGLPSMDGTGQTYPPELCEEALRLCEAGMSNRQAALMLGINKTTVDRWVRRATGRAGKSNAGQTRQRLARERAQRLAWRKEQRRKAARRTGGSAGAAYAMLRRTAEILDRAIGETEDRDLKGALSRALSDIHKADDAIVEAMGWEHGQGRKAA